MKTRNKRKPAAAVDVPSDILDRPHLSRYTMDNPDLEREIIGLFLQQLPSTLDMLKQAASAADWKLATHTLKGSAAAVGATGINVLAVELEKLAFDANVNVKSILTESLEAAIERFRDAVDRIPR